MFSMKKWSLSWGFYSKTLGQTPYFQNDTSTPQNPNRRKECSGLWPYFQNGTSTPQNPNRRK